MTFYEWWDSKDTVVPSIPRELAKMAWDAALASRGDVQGEYICKCGVRVEPHRCATGTDF